MSKLTPGQFNTDKTTYLKFYEEYFAKYQDQAIKLFEIGIYNGGSLLMWRDYFAKGEITGLDINEFKYPKEEERIHIYQGDQKDISLLEKITKEQASEKFDIIIDDASHFGHETFVSFIYLFKNSLKPGGIYVIEDWGTGYWPHYPDGRLPQIDAHHVSHHLHNDTDYEFKKRGLWDKQVMFSNRRFQSHDFGMVGVLKQIIDEIGNVMGVKDELDSGSSKAQSMISKIVVTQGQAFIYKN